MSTPLRRHAAHSQHGSDDAFLHAAARRNRCPRSFGISARREEETARDAAYVQRPGRFRRWWQVSGSNQRRLSRRFTARSLPPESPPPLAPSSSRSPEATRTPGATPPSYQATARRSPSTSPSDSNTHPTASGQTRPVAARRVLLVSGARTRLPLCLPHAPSPGSQQHPGRTRRQRGQFSGQDDSDQIGLSWFRRGRCRRPGARARQRGRLGRTVRCGR